MKRANGGGPMFSCRSVAHAKADAGAEHRVCTVCARLFIPSSNPCWWNRDGGSCLPRARRAALVHSSMFFLWPFSSFCATFCLFLEHSGGGKANGLEKGGSGKGRGWRAKSKSGPWMDRAGLDRLGPVTGSRCALSRAGRPFLVGCVRGPGQYNLYPLLHQRPTRCLCCDPNRPAGTAGSQAPPDQAGERSRQLPTGKWHRRSAGLPIHWSAGRR